jgi:heptaprenyl diphosphate synthase
MATSARDAPLLLQASVARLRQRIDDRLLEATRADDPTMEEMASHLVRTGGKRLRPLITALASVTDTGDGDTPTTRHGTDDPPLDGQVADSLDDARDPATDAQLEAVLDQVSEDAITGAVAVELVHVGSLHHDDVIDEAETRHNVESVNARWGNLRAILSGDFLLARASELAAPLGPDVAELLAATIGKLCQGEVHELTFAYQIDRSEDAYFAAISNKTAALYSTAARVGGLVAHLPRERVETLGEFGRSYGMAFQIVDDILDVVATDDELGKPAGHDMAAGVYNLPVLRALQGPDRDELRALLGVPLDDVARIRARDLVRRSHGLRDAVEIASSFAEQAVEALARLDPGPATQVLVDAVGSLLAGLDGKVNDSSDEVE